MRNSFQDFMFVKLNDEQKKQLMNTMYSIISESKDGEKNSPYVGMPKSKLEKSSRGQPYEINITEVENHVFEQWCYSNGRYVYVDDGYVSAIQK